MKLQAKATLLAAAAGVLALASADAVFVLAQKNHFLRVTQRFDRNVLRGFAEDAARSAADRDLAALGRRAQFLAQGPGGAAYAYILTGNGAFAVHSDPDFTWKTPADWEPARKTEGMRELREPVSLYGDVAGEAVIGFRTTAAERMHQGQLRDMLPPLLYVNLTIILLVLAASIVVSRVIIRPVRELAGAAKDIAGGRLDVRVPVRSRDEIGMLQGEFNAMAGRLKEVDELKTEFLAKITHDLRNPLGAVMGYAEVMLLGIKGPISPQQQGCLKLIISNADYLSELINNILDVTKLEAGRMEYARSAVEFRETVAPVVDLMKVKADEYGVSLSHEVPEGVRVYADPQALRRVVVNLVSNALKFTPKGGEVQVSAAPEPGGGLRAWVADNGIGIPQEKLGRLFSKFVQVHDHKDLPRQVRGTGLGLTICKEIVEGHGGRIWVESESGRGTTFLFSIPPAAAPEAQPAAAPGPQPAPGRFAGGQGSAA